MALQLVACGHTYILRVDQKIRRLYIPLTDIVSRSTGTPAKANGRGPVP
jgi:hypothetical protein